MAWTATVDSTKANGIQMDVVMAFVNSDGRIVKRTVTVSSPDDVVSFGVAVVGQLTALDGLTATAANAAIVASSPAPVRVLGPILVN